MAEPKGGPGPVIAGFAPWFTTTELPTTFLPFYFFGSPLKQRTSVNLGNLVLSLSDALDLAYTSLAMHQQRTAFVAWELGRAAGIGGARLETLFLAALLHDIGALSTEEKRSLHANEVGEVREVAVHCVQGARLFEATPWLASAAPLVLHHHRPFRDWSGSHDAAQAFDAQLLCLADTLERHVDRSTYVLHQDQPLRDFITSQAGDQFSPDAVALFREISAREEFWLDLTSPRLYSLLLHNGPFRAIDVDVDSVGLYAELLSRIVDFKSPFTATHSAGVAECATLLARVAGMSEPEVRWMTIAGLLHDLGKLVVPNAILEKPAGLTPAEFAVIKQHTYFTYSIVSTIEGLQTIAEWGAFHHERLDGRGYPFHRNADDLVLGSRVMAVADMFTAMAEDRPYRPGIPLVQVSAILREQAAKGLQDGRVVSALLDHLSEIAPAVAERQAAARSSYQQAVARA